MIRTFVVVTSILSSTAAFASEAKELKANTMSLITIGVKCGSIEKSNRIYKLVSLTVPVDKEDAEQLKQVSEAILRKYDELDNLQRTEFCQMAKGAIEIMMDKLKL